MNREFLKKLGLEDDAVNSIMAEYGKAVEKYKNDAETLKTRDTEIASLNEQLKAANAQIEDFKGVDIDGIKKAAEEYKTKFEQSEKAAKESLDKLKFDYALDSALTGAKAKNNKAVKALLELDGIRFKDGKLSGFDEQIQNLKQENGYLFDTEDGAPKFSSGTAAAVGADDDSAIRAVMGLAPKTN